MSRLKGIGRAICLELAKEGTDIFFTYWKEYDRQMPWAIQNDEHSQIQAEIEQTGVRCGSIELDLREKSSIETLFNAAQHHLGAPTILVNNATYSTQTTIDEYISTGTR